MKKNYSWSGLFFVTLAQIMVAINIVASKWLLSSIPALMLLEIRFALASVILLALHYLPPIKQQSIYHYLAKLEWKDWMYLMAQALTAGILFNLLMLWGLQYSDANTAGIITSALPAMIAVLSWLILGEQITFKKMLYIIAITLGLLIVASKTLFSTGMNHSFSGNLLIFLSLLPEAFYYILSKIHIVRLPIFLTSALLNGVNALLLLIPVFLLDNVSFNVGHWTILFILGFSSGLFYVFWYFGCQKVDGITASLSTAIMPVTTVLFAWIMLGEYLDLTQMIGLFTVLVSIIFYVVI